MGDDEPDTDLSVAADEQQGDDVPEQLDASEIPAKTPRTRNEIGEAPPPEPDLKG
jgi:hypothetical protein